MASSLSALLERSGNPAIGADESLRLALGVKIDTKKRTSSEIYHLGEIYDAMMLFKPASIKDYKDSHHFSCDIRV
jgi:hypothetical protein